MRQILCQRVVMRWDASPLAVCEKRSNCALSLIFYALLI